MARSTGLACLLLGAAIGCATLANKPVAAPAADQALPTEGMASDGKVVRLADQRGRVVLLSFWHGA